jgi:diguanylate cyclase (GGDEF)-like protein/PAS domain S-box-containing protein
MYRVLTCLSTQHDYRLLFLAVLICAVAAVTTFSVYSRAVATSGFKSLGWIFLTAVCAAAGIWSTHFVAMLAYDSALPTAYDPIVTAASLIAAAVATTLGFVICARRNLVAVTVGGAVIGAGIGVMHFTGMRALIIPGRIEWDTSLVAASLAFGVVFASLALFAFHWFDRSIRIWIAAGLLTLAICALHFTAMGAALIVPDPTVAAQAVVVDSDMIAIGIAGLTALVMLGGLVPAYIDSHTSREAADHIREIFDAANDGMVVATDGVVVNANRWVLDRCDMSPDQLIGQSVMGDLLEGLPQPFDISETGPVEAMLKVADGTLIPVEVVAQPVRSGLQGNEVYAIHDLTERRRSDAQIAYLAHHDGLSGLPNRMRVKERIKQALIDVAPGTNLAVFCLNIDSFKGVNDRYGHSVGDDLLKSVAKRLRRIVRTPNFAARLGGDEFAVVQTRVRHKGQTEALATRLCSELSRPHNIAGRSISISVSIGITTAPDDGVNVDGLLRNTGIALCHAKASERSSFVFFRPEHEKRLRERHELEGGLKIALRDGQFELHYQPIVDLKTREVTCFEALMRWQHPERGLVSPADFIPFAEEAGLIRALGDWALRQACRDAATWPGHIRVAVNLSAMQFAKSNMEIVTMSALRDAGLDPKRLELEVTESVLLRDETNTQETLRKLRALGVGVSLDDFGTAFASLNYLRSFPFDRIKIDQIFVRDMPQRDDCVAIVRAVAALARVLGIKTVAEGVETQRHLNEVMGAHCDEAQGFYFSRAVPVKEVGTVLSFCREKLSAAA